MLVYVKYNNIPKWSIVLKEVILPFYKEMNNRHLLKTKLEIIIISFYDPVQEWLQYWKTIFPEYQFKFMQENPRYSFDDYDITIYNAWNVCQKNDLLYNRYISLEDIMSFQNHLFNLLKPPIYFKFPSYLHYPIIIVNKLPIKRHLFYSDNFLNNVGDRITNNIKTVDNANRLLKMIHNKLNVPVLCIDTCELSLREKFHLFQMAKIVIGQYGTGLIHSLFMKPGNHIIELTNEKYYYRSFVNQICEVMNHNYYYAKHQNKIDTRIQVNIDSIVSLIRLILKGKRNNKGFAQYCLNGREYYL